MFGLCLVTIRPSVLTAAFANANLLIRAGVLAPSPVNNLAGTEASALQTEDGDGSEDEPAVQPGESTFPELFSGI